MPLAMALNRRQPGWCWASFCVDLGLGWNLREPLAKARASGPICRDDAQLEGSCWCGKMMSRGFRQEIEARQMVEPIGNWPRECPR